ncbi:hypothetical protein AXK30_25545 [Escherichia coli]|nr:hypothetical protein AXK30_25545 [Escherichia coli]
MDHQPPYQSRFAAAGHQVLEASPQGHYTQLVVQPAGAGTNEPLTVVMHGDDARSRGDAFIRVCNMRGCITATSVS